MPLGTQAAKRKKQAKQGFLPRKRTTYRYTAPAQTSGRGGYRFNPDFGGGAGMKIGKRPSTRTRQRKARKIQIPPPLWVRMQQPNFWNARTHKEVINTPDSTNAYLPVNWTLSMPSAASYDLCYILIGGSSNIRLIRVSENQHTRFYGNDHFLTNPPKTVRNMRQTIRITNITRNDSRAGYVRVVKMTTGFDYKCTRQVEDGVEQFITQPETMNLLRNYRDQSETFTQYSANQAAAGLDFSAKPANSVPYRSYQVYDTFNHNDPSSALSHLLAVAGMETVIVFVPEVAGGLENVQTFQVNGYFQDACTFDPATMLGTLMTPPPTINTDVPMDPRAGAGLGNVPIGGGIS